VPQTENEGGGDIKNYCAGQRKARKLSKCSMEKPFRKGRTRKHARRTKIQKTYSWLNGKERKTP